MTFGQGIVVADIVQLNKITPATFAIGAAQIRDAILSLLRGLLTEARECHMVKRNSLTPEARRRGVQFSARLIYSLHTRFEEHVERRAWNTDGRQELVIAIDPGPHRHVDE